MVWLQDHGWIVGAIVAAALALTGLAWRSARRRPARPVPGAAARWPERPIPGADARRRVDLTFVAAVLVTLAVGWAAVIWLLGQADQVPAGKDRAAVRADAVRTGATIALGTGGVAYLLLAYRRQRLDEVDTRERRITELYTKAVEQLGHDKAPVRLGALYSLERLAQNNPEHRHTVADVYCAYLRMPYTPTPPAHSEDGAERVEDAASPADVQDQAPHPAPGQDPAQELQVRQTAQRLLADHLRVSAGSGVAAQDRQGSPRWGFWPHTRLDLTGAVLVDVGFAWVSVLQADFTGATFHGDANFTGATFHGDGNFTGTTFYGEANFIGATFLQGDTQFRGATFRGKSVFARMTFHIDADFTETTFHRDAVFSELTFTQDKDIISSAAAKIAGAVVLNLDKPGIQRVWPQPWTGRYTIRPDADDPTRGTLVYAEQVEEPEPAIPSSDRPAGNGLGTG